MAELCVFNENTRYWSESWPRQYFLRKLGFKRRASQITDEFEKETLQSLWKGEEIDAAVKQSFAIKNRFSFFSESTFFFATLFSRAMGITAPLDNNMRKFLVSPGLRWCAVPFTLALAELLIEYDLTQDRSRDAFICYVAKSAKYKASDSDNYLRCPECRQELSAMNACPECKKSYPSVEKMLFLLPGSLESVYTEYDQYYADSVPDFHL